MYAVTDGEYKGDFLVFTSNKATNGMYAVMSLPDLREIFIPENEIRQGIEMGVLDYVEKLSRSVYNELENQIKIRETKMFEERTRLTNEYNNRRQQFTTPGVLDIEESAN